MRCGAACHYTQVRVMQPLCIGFETVFEPAHEIMVIIT